MVTHPDLITFASNSRRIQIRGRSPAIRDVSRSTDVRQQFATYPDPRTFASNW